MSGAADLVAHARHTRVTVVGGGIAGLVAALECAKVGMPVTVVEASDRLGGCVAAAELDGRILDVAADGFSTSGGHVRALVDELGLGDSVVAPLPGGRWIAGLPGHGSASGDAAPLPEDTVLGIPANSWAEDVRRFIGWRGAWRAYLDRLRPPLTIGHERRLGTLVRTRMGERVLEAMVAPVTRGVFGVEPDDIDVDAAAPGLNAALTRAGSLSGAVAQVLAEGPSGARASLEGGMHRLVDALARALTDLGAELRTGFQVGAVRHDDAAGWTVSREPVPGAGEQGESATEGTERTAEPSTLDAAASGETAAVGGSVDARYAEIRHADVENVAAGSRRPDDVASDLVIVAVDEAAARRLLASVVSLPEGPAPASVDVVTLVVADPGLDSRPRGHAVFPAQRTASATTGLVHATATWEWLARDAPGIHVLRVTFPTANVAALPDAEAVAAAVEAASALLGVTLHASQVRAAHRARYPFAPPAAALGRAERAAAVRAAARTTPGLAVTGAWLGGSGLARVVADATAEADRVRGSALWGSARVDDA